MDSLTKTNSNKCEMRKILSSRQNKTDLNRKLEASQSVKKQIKGVEFIKLNAKLKAIKINR